MLLPSTEKFFLNIVFFWHSLNSEETENSVQGLPFFIITPKNISNNEFLWLEEYKKSIFHLVLFIIHHPKKRPENQIQPLSGDESDGKRKYQDKSKNHQLIVDQQKSLQDLLFNISSTVWYGAKTAGRLWFISSWSWTAAWNTLWEEFRVYIWLFYGYVDAEAPSIVIAIVLIYIYIYIGIHQ